MWLFTKIGFYSVVQPDTVAADEVMVRGRDLGDMGRLTKLLPSGTEVLRTDVADYQYRMVCKKADFEAALASLVDGIDYPNFKAAVAKRDKVRARLYSRVWAVMLNLQESFGRLSGF